MGDTKALKKQIENKDLKFIIAGDSRQIDPVNDRVRFDYLSSRTLHELCDGNRLLLTKCRRSQFVSPMPRELKGIVSGWTN